jgi:hypothetical protein
MGEWGEEMKRDFKETISAAADNKKINISFIENYSTKRIAIQLQRDIQQSDTTQTTTDERNSNGERRISRHIKQTTANGSIGASTYDIR